MYEIIFSGGSHYGEGALLSIQQYFDKIYLLSSNDENIKKHKRPSDVIISDFLDVPCKYVFLAGHSDFISKSYLDKKIFINVHGSLLPKYRGMHSTFWAIMNGEKELGISFHIVDQYMDSGEIIGQYKFDYSNQSIEMINKQIDKLVHIHSGKTLTDYINNKIVPVPQNKYECTFGCKRNISDCIIDFELPYEYIERFFKALTKPYPLPMLNIKGEKFEVLDHLLVKNDYYCTIGRVLNIDDLGVWIKFKEGFLIIKQVRKYSDGTEYNLSNLIKIGYRFLK